MSNDNKIKTRLVGVRLSPQVIEKMDEIIKQRGGTRQDIIINAVNQTLFRS